MKTFIQYVAFIILITISINSGIATAQNWEEINPDGIEILADADLVRAVIVTIEPGETIGPVTHPAHFAYILGDGTLKVTYAGQDPVVMDLKKGMALFNEPEGAHTVENTGNESISFMLVELKEHPYKGS